MSSSGGGACCYLCNECSRSFTTLVDLECHLSVHAKVSLHSQDAFMPESATQGSVEGAEEEDSSHHSPSSSEGSDGREEEMKEEGEETPPSLTCRHCAQHFEDSDQLTLHLLSVHNERAAPYACSVCSEVFSVKRELATHARLHAGEQPHECSQCGKTFGTRQLLKKHCMWHTGERSHVCRHCNKAFFQKGHLTQHLMIHNGQRPHQCTQCNKTFIFKFDLNRHMKIHSERGFSCRRCRRNFLKQASLDEHKAKCKGGPSTPVKREPAADSAISTTPRHSLPAPIPSSVAASSPLSSLSLTSTPSNIPALMAGLSREELTRMAEKLLGQQAQQLQHQHQQQHSSLAESPLSALSDAPSGYVCCLCSARLANAAQFALHLSVSHFQPYSQQSQKILEDGVIPPEPVSLSAFVPMRAIKTEEMSGADTATNSSGASSPQKASPSTGSSTPPCTMECSSSPPSRPPFSSLLSKCSHCDENASRVSELEAALLSSKQQLALAHQLLSSSMLPSLNGGGAKLEWPEALASGGYIPPSSSALSSLASLHSQLSATPARTPLFSQLQSLFQNLQMQQQQQ